MGTFHRYDQRSREELSCIVAFGSIQSLEVGSVSRSSAYGEPVSWGPYSGIEILSYQKPERFYPLTAQMNVIADTKCLIY